MFKLQSYNQPIVPFENQIYKHLNAFTSQLLEEYFGNNIVFAFAHEHRSVSMVTHENKYKLCVCLVDRDPESERLFKTQILDEKLKQGIPPQAEDSIRIITLKELDEILEEGNDPLSTLRPNFMVSNCFTWSQDLAERKIFLKGDLDLLQAFEIQCRLNQLQWKTQITKELPGSFLSKYSAHSQARNVEKTESPFLKKILEDKQRTSDFLQDDLSYRSLSLSEILEKLKKDRPALVSSSTKIMLDGADGDFEPYGPAATEYNSPLPDIRRYIPFDKQYTFSDSAYDRRKPLMQFAIQAGIAREDMRDELSSIVTGSGTGYILNKIIQALNNNKGHAFLVPTPTYGYFIPAFEACGAKPVFLDSKPYPQYEIPPEELEKQIIQQNEHLYRENIKMFISQFRKFIDLVKAEKILGEEINEQLTLQGKEEKLYPAAKKFHSYMQKNSQELEKKYGDKFSKLLTSYPELPRVTCLYFINPHNPLGVIFDQDYITAIAEIAYKYELTIIEDLTHLELLHPLPQRQIGFFNRTGLNIPVVSLISPSKALCMAECRVGYALINTPSLVTAYQEQVFNDGLFLGKKQLRALENAFVMNPERDQYVVSHAQEYRERIALIQYILHPEMRNSIPMATLERIIDLFKKHNIHLEEFSMGIPGLRMLNPNPESGFFAVLEFTNIRGSYFLDALINNNKDLSKLLEIFNIAPLTGENLYSTDKLLMRFPVCEAPALVLAALLRLKAITKSLLAQPISAFEKLNSSKLESPPIEDTAYEEETSLVTAEKRIKYVQRTCEKLKQKIAEKADDLTLILSDYQTYGVSEYEIERCIRTLDRIQENEQYLSSGKQIEASAVMLPSNLPLYSLVVFSLIPSFLCDHVYVRPNSLLQQANIISRIYDALELKSIFPRVQIINSDHSGFSPYIKKADMVVFTGKPSNADSFLQLMKEDALLIVNGAGHNPLVVTESADIDEAVKGALLVKGFNGGQDCAGPDAILVHESVAQEFIGKFEREYSKLKQGTFKQKDTIIGPIQRWSEIQRLSELLFVNRSDIFSGGKIDFTTGLLSPTVIVRNIDRSPNYQEVFGPIAFIHPYRNDEDLSHYFESGQYFSNRMYLSVYGHSPYLAKRDDVHTPGAAGNVGIILYDETIHDVEIGVKPYGGYSLGASGIIKKTGEKSQRIAMPILLPQIIVDYLINKSPFPQKEISQTIRFFTSSRRTGKVVDDVIEGFKAIAIDIFKENLVFGFVFGSAAAGKLNVSEKDKDDLDTFICLRAPNPDQTHAYLKKIEQLHDKFNLKVDRDYPAEIVCLDELEKTISSLPELRVSVERCLVGDDYDSLFWTHALTNTKKGVIGDGKTMFGFIKRCEPYIKCWSESILEELEAMELLPKHLQDRFPGLEKDKILEKLSQYSSHLIIHLGLEYGNEREEEACLSHV